MNATPQSPVLHREPSEASLRRYERVRRFTEHLAAPLAPEDQVVQTMPDVSPTKWHLAHTTWFFETFLLETRRPGYRPFHPQFKVLFNSYYNTVGDQWARPRRGLLSRPTVAEVLQYRAHVDEAMRALIRSGALDGDPDARLVLEVGINHEQQHQELLLTDIKHVLSVNPLHPAYEDRTLPPADRPPAQGWVEHPGGILEIGHGGEGFAYDNEGPRHEELVRPFALADRLVTNGEYLEFVEAGGYTHHEPWLSDAWSVVVREAWQHPLYWEREGGAWHEFTLAGRRPLDPHRPVSHLSFYEADAYARWRGERLPSEAEWEVMAQEHSVAGNFVEDGLLHTAGASAGPTPAQLFGDVWEWTSSPYLAYPGFRPLGGALGEYNGKFMSNQMVLRGGSWATHRDHVRASYRNFFPPDARWQVTGLRLARGA